MRAYRQSKLADLMFAFELDRRLRAANSRVMSVAAHPGVCFSGYTFVFLTSAIAPATSPPTGSPRIPTSIVFEGEYATRYPTGALSLYHGGRNTTLSPLPCAGPGNPRSAIQS